MNCIVTAVISVCILKHLSKLVNFCVATFMLKMEENTQHFRHIVLCYFKKGKSHTWNAKKIKICAVYGEGAVSGRTWQMWFVKFCASHFSLDDALQSGRPVEVGSNQIKTLTENNQCYTTQERADILKISKSIKLWVKMKNMPFILQKQPLTDFLANSIYTTVIHLLYKWGNGHPQRLNNWPAVTQPISCKSRILSHATWIQTQFTKTLCYTAFHKKTKKTYKITIFTPDFLCPWLLIRSGHSHKIIVVRTDNFCTPFRGLSSTLSSACKHINN